MLSGQKEGKRAGHQEGRSPVLREGRDSWTKEPHPPLPGPQAAQRRPPAAPPDGPRTFYCTHWDH